MIVESIHTGHTMPIEKSDKHKTDNKKRILVAGDVLGKFSKFYKRLKVNTHSSL